MTIDSKRDEQRRQEDQRIDFGQRDRREGVDAEHAGDEAGEGARVHGPWPLHAPEAVPLLAFRLEEEQEDAGEQDVEEADLEDRQMSAEALDDAIAPRIDGIPRQGQNDAALHAWAFPEFWLDAGAATPAGSLSTCHGAHAASRASCNGGANTQDCLGHPPVRLPLRRDLAQRAIAFPP